MAFPLNRTAWIDAAERMPEFAVHCQKDPNDAEDFDAWWSHTCYVAGTLKGGKRVVRKGRYEKDPDGERWATDYNGWWEDEVEQVTHWLEIPPPPPWPELPEAA